MTRFCGMIEQVKKRYYLEGCEHFLFAYLNDINPVPKGSKKC
jgi:hypothetical protein